MGPQERNLHNIPVDMVVCILKKLLLVGGFEDFYNLFIVWSQTQRPAVIINFLHAYPVEELYRYARSKNEQDVRWFYRFVCIAGSLNIPAARCYMPCQNMICAIGYINPHLDVLLRLSNNGHFLSRLAHLIFQSFINADMGIDDATALMEICSDPHYRKQIAPTLGYLKDIQAHNPPDSLLQRETIHTRCDSHTGRTGVPPVLMRNRLGECIKCDIAYILSVFRDS